jgi:hypothetical protein
MPFLQFISFFSFSFVLAFAGRTVPLAVLAFETPAITPA